MASSISRRKFVSGSAAALAALGAFGLVGCAKSPSEDIEGKSSGSNDKETASAVDVTIRLGGLKDPASMGMIKMLSDAERGLTNNKYDFTMSPTDDELTSAILQGNLDMISAPSNVGAIMYNSSRKSVEMLAANMLGAIYVLEHDAETIKGIEDLKGRTIYAVGKGSASEYVLGYLLEQHGLTVDMDVSVEWKNDPAEIVELLTEGTAELAMLSQPFAAVAQTQVKDLKIALDMNAEWEALDNDGKFITSVIIARSEFVEQHPQQVVEFLRELAESTEWVNANVEEAAELIEKYDIVEAPIARMSLPYCNIVCISGEGMSRITEAYFRLLLEQNPDLLGGSIPEADFYYDAAR